MKNIILASGSPRRRELMEQIGLSFQVIVSKCEENADDSNPAEYVCSLSKLKCLDVANGIESKEIIPENQDSQGFLVIGSDTIVVYDNKILGKPSNEEQAFEMLKMLQGNVHSVFTGVSIKDTMTGKLVTFYEKTDVTMFSMSDKEIWEYIKTKEPMDKAGSYGIQGKGATFISKINGDYYTVVGLPIARLKKELDQF